MAVHVRIISVARVAPVYLLEKCDTVHQDLYLHIITIVERLCRFWSTSSHSLREPILSASRGFQILSTQSLPVELWQQA